MEIDKCYPIPKFTHGLRDGATYYPFNDMEIGDSIFVEGVAACARAANAARKTAARKNKHFLVRRVDGGVRIWRTE